MNNGDGTFAAEIRFGFNEINRSVVTRELARLVAIYEGLGQPETAAQ